MIELTMSRQPILQQTLSPNLNMIVEGLIEAIPTEHEIVLLGIIAQMDQALQELMSQGCEDTESAIKQTYSDIDNYLDERRLEN